MNIPISVYHELREVSPEKARLLVRKVLYQNKGNVTKTAKIPGISRNTVWFSGSSRKKEEWNKILGLFESNVYNIPLMGIVENSHRADDENFLIVHGGYVENSNQFMMKAQRWQDVWNKVRRSWGIDMGGKTPFEKLREVHDGLLNLNVVNFPVITLESLASKVHSAFSWLTNFEPLYLLLFGGKYLLVRCQAGLFQK